MAETLEKAGDFILDLAEIILVTGDSADITDHVIGITLYEDIQSPLLAGTISFNDNANLKDLGPLLGQEILKLKIRTPSMKKDDEIIEAIFSLFNHTHSSNLNQDNTVHHYKFISMEAIEDARTKVCRPMSGTTSSIVSSVVRNDLKSKKHINEETSVGIRNIIGTEESPLKLIKRLEEQAVSEKYGSPSYLFFENLDGFHFRSLESLYEQAPTQSFYQSSDGGYSTKLRGFTNVLEEFGAIRKLTCHTNINYLAWSSGGGYASELITHDIYNKKISHGNNYHYFNSFDKEKHINSFHGKNQSPIHSKIAVDDNGSTVADFPSKTYLLPTSFSDDAKKIDAHYTDVLGNSKNFNGYNPASWLTKRTSLMSNLNVIAAEIEVDGNTLLRAGHMVEINLSPISPGKQEKKTKPDRFFNGAFLVRHIMHEFFDIKENRKGSHILRASCVKDCVEETLPSTDRNPEPKVFGTNKEKPKIILV